MILVMEMIFGCVLFTFLFVLGNRKNPLSGLHNMPVALQERVASLPEYSDMKVIHVKQRILKKLPAMIILMILFSVLIILTGARNFEQGFRNSFLLWFVIKVYVVIVLYCGWLAHTPSVWIPGSEDMKECYQNYRFYLKSIPGSLIAGALVSVIVGIIISIVQ